MDKNQAEIDRILNSETLRSSDALRVLLHYLAEQSRSGNTARLKEYTIGVEALGKPENYDPRQDSIVRIQVGRLRQKLAEYYQGEGKDDPILVGLPKGHFSLIWSERGREAAHFPELHPTYLYVLPLVILLAGLLTWSFSTVQERKARQESISRSSSLAPELETLWAPFLVADRPLLVVVSAPLFVAWPGNILRDSSLNQPEDITKSRSLPILMKGLKVEQAKPIYKYTDFGNLTATFLLGKLFGDRKQISIVNSSEVTLQHFAEANILFVGSSRFFRKTSLMPIEQPLELESGFGVRNLQPLPGEPLEFRDQYEPSGSGGTSYALISHTPGPQGNGDVESFESSTSAGINGAIQWFTNPLSAKTMVNLLRKPSGELPRYYQVVLKVKFLEKVPVDTSCAFYHELNPSGR